VACRRHPNAASFREHCAACLLEEALAPEHEEFRARTRQLTIQVPLGESTSSSVFLVKSGGPAPRLLRLKTWRRPAVAGFLARFHRLQAQLESWGVEDIDRPLAASVDASGCPSVLTVFRQGVPILDRVRSGRLDREEAVARLTPLIALMVSAHARGLAHGSIVPGNVIVGPDSAPARLLDFGHATLMAPSENDATLAVADLAGFAVLARGFRELPLHPAPTRRP
jgi:serine/threonine protein kinase